jgi:hypothetical protein
MRVTVTIMLSLCMALAATASARADESPADPEKPSARAEVANETSAMVDAKTESVPVEATKAAEEKFVPPDGWKTKKRGPFTVYCRKEQAKGTRIQQEVCHDEAGIRAMLREQEEDRERVDQMRRICAGDASCGAN